MYPILLAASALAADVPRTAHARMEGSIYTQGSAQETLVIHDDAELAAFTARIPRGPGGFAWESVPLELGKRWLVVLVRSDTVAAPPVLESVVVDDGQGVVHFRLPDPPEGARAPAVGTGAYAAVLVDALPSAPSWITWPETQRATGRIYAGADETLVISDQAAYDAFVSRLPTSEITPTQPAPPSTDPYLKHPPIDFSRFTLVVAVRADSMYVPPRITEVVFSDPPTVGVEHPPLGDAAFAAAQQGVGTYDAAVIRTPTAGARIVP
jgi:hypothetical protein